VDSVFEFKIKIGADKLKKLTTIGNARSWAKAGAIPKIFGKYDDGEAVNNSLYVYVLVSWLEIALVCSLTRLPEARQKL
jgi:hypothetical protein